MTEDEIDSVEYDTSLYRIGDAFLCISDISGNEMGRTLHITDIYVGGGLYIGFKEIDCIFSRKSLSTPLCIARYKLIPIDILEDKSVFTFKMTHDINHLELK